MGASSLYNNIKSGNVGAAIVDGIGVVADVGAIALPGVPGGAGLAIKATRGAISAAQKLDKAANLVQGATATVEAAQSGDVVGAVAAGVQTAAGAKGSTPGSKTAKETSDANKKLGPNPNGSKGKPDHQEANDQLVDEMRAKHPDAEIRSNQSIESESGLKRRPDAAAVKDGKVHEVGEVARTNKNGTIVSREQRSRINIQRQVFPQR